MIKSKVLIYAFFPDEIIPDQIEVDGDYDNLLIQGIYNTKNVAYNGLSMTKSGDGGWYIENPPVGIHALTRS